MSVFRRLWKCGERKKEIKKLSAIYNGSLALATLERATIIISNKSVICTKMDVRLYRFYSTGFIGIKFWCDSSLFDLNTSYHRTTNSQSAYGGKRCWWSSRLCLEVGTDMALRFVAPRFLVALENTVKLWYILLSIFIICVSFADVSFIATLSNGLLTFARHWHGLDWIISINIWMKIALSWR